MNGFETKLLCFMCDFGKLNFFHIDLLLAFISPLFTCMVSLQYVAKRQWKVYIAEETLKWRNITVAAYIACIALGIYTFAGEEHHEASERQVSAVTHSLF